jgi:hypothetical protein
VIAQLILSSLLFAIILYAWAEYHRVPIIGILFIVGSGTGLYFVWVPSHATLLAELAGVGRGVDLISYLWSAISLLMILNLHLKLRAQMELITVLARTIALNEAHRTIEASPIQHGDSSMDKSTPLPKLVRTI